MQNIILSGGSGTRLWPLSRTLMPKQFVKLIGDKSLFQYTVKRNQACCNSVKIITNEGQYFLAKDQLSEIGVKEAYFLLEPFGKNTAPAIALACFELPKDEIVLVTPSDHLVTKLDNYYKAVKQAEELANEDFLVTFGIQPSHPETGYGYIETHQNDVKSFHEKPTTQVAQHYLEQGNYYWNSGIFCFKAGVFLEELKKVDPDTYDKCAQVSQKLQNNSVQRISKTLMSTLPDKSIDYAVMEKSQQIKMIPVEMGWTDLGSFESLDQILEKDENGNTKHASLITDNSCNNFIYGGKSALVLIDVQDLVIVETQDAMMIAKKGSSQKIKKVIERIKKTKPELAAQHPLVSRPWGHYEILQDAPLYKVKKIIVAPGRKLSLQKHFHRNEHWIVVSGTATVTIDEKTFLVRPNESTYIQMGQVHRLENQGKIDLVMIEVQVGEYTGEDDIVRIDDIYGRDTAK